ncbi:MAG: methionyl-tRNA formyltransferase, partial [Clostridiales bacterium]|nr:methionyl-tRNA formyltransferase [Clostridiales bacterium]
TGAILSVVETDIGESETAGELTARLADLGAKLLTETLDGFDKIVPKKQDDAAATLCRTIKKSEQIIDFKGSAKKVVDKIRALSPLPCAKTLINGEQYKLYSAAVSETSGNGIAGEIVRCDSKLVIACDDGCIEILKIQAPSKRALDIADFLRGKKFAVGTVCGK